MGLFYKDYYAVILVPNYLGIPSLPVQYSSAVVSRGACTRASQCKRDRTAYGRVCRGSSVLEAFGTFLE